MFSTQPVQSGFSELQLHQTAAALAASLSQEPGIRVVNPQFLDGISPLAGRFDFKSEAITGFPYSLLHASLLGELLAGLIHNGQAKKGLITDLDDTLWGGILGEDGVNGISWHLEQRTHIHGIYQQFLASLASAGVLIGVASKNDAAVVEQAFDRRDLLISRNDIFPFEAHWSRKSESVDRIIKTWNIDPSAVVFVDDSPMEVAEVKAAFPELECIVFPKGDYQGIWGLLKHLRTAFGRPFLTEDDSLRMRSIRDSGAWREALESPAGSSDEFLRAVEACIVFHWGKQKEDGRAFELVNKTNQFNLNGRRFDESEWLGFFSDPDGFSLTVSYQDKYGSLGKVAVILGTSGECKLNVKCWVMSCRAFSRRIEYQCLRYLFEKLGSDEILFEYESTPRNGPVQDFLKELLGSPPSGRALLSRERFEMNVPALFHQVTEVTSA
jgi:FkbH-like protein